MQLRLADERYHCTGCGDCCRGWAVPLRPGEADRFRAQAAAFVPAERLAALVTRTRGIDTLAVGAGCAALDQEQRCRVHAAHGADAKPLACRLFPFRFVVTPDDVRVSLSFACPAVVDGEGPRLDEQRDEIARLYDAVASAYTVRVADEVALSATHALRWAEAAELCAALAEALRGGGSLVERVCRAGAITALLLARLDDGRAFAEALAEARAGAAALVAEALVAPPAVDRLSRAFLRTVLESTAPGARAGSRLMGTFASLFGGSGAKLAAPGLGADGEALLARWLVGEVEGLTFFGRVAFGLSLCDGLDLLTLTAAAVASLARQLAAADGRDAVAPGDVKRALRQVYAGVHHRTALPPRFERALAATACLDLLRSHT